MFPRKAGSKRKFQEAAPQPESLDAYQAFSQAASAVSGLFVAAQRAEKKGKRAGLEAVASWAVKEYGHVGAVPLQHLLAFLQAELSAGPASPQQAPLAVVPQPLALGMDASAESDEDMAAPSQQSRQQPRQQLFGPQMPQMPMR
eukprot:scaffold11.g3935.t1